MFVAQPVFAHNEISSVCYVQELLRFCEVYCNLILVCPSYNIKRNHNTIITISVCEHIFGVFYHDVCMVSAVYLAIVKVPAKLVNIFLAASLLSL